MTVEVLRFPEFWFDDPIVAKQRASLECGCSVLVGVRIDRDPPEPATGFRACSPDHQELVDRARDALLETIPTDSTEPLVAVCDQLLREAADGSPEGRRAGEKKVQALWPDEVEDGDEA